MTFAVVVFGGDDTDPDDEWRVDATVYGTFETDIEASDFVSMLERITAWANKGVSVDYMSIDPPEQFDQFNTRGAPWPKERRLQAAARSHGVDPERLRALRDSERDKDGFPLDQQTEAEYWAVQDVDTDV